jgi:hypothetical protein
LGKSVIRLGSVTNSIKIKKLLSKNGIRCEVVKVGLRDGDSGCSYGIAFNNEKYFDVVLFLKNWGVEYTLVNTA